VFLESWPALYKCRLVRIEDNSDNSFQTVV
jgi:hypothetical protein